MPTFDDERVVRLLPQGLLLVAALVASIAAPSLGDGAAELGVTLAVAAVTSGWMAVVPRGGAVHWVGRTALAFVLCWLNPFFGIFAFVGFLDAAESLPRRWAHLGLGVVAVTQAGSQSGGLPPDDATQGLAFAVLAFVNLGLVTVFSRIGRLTEERNADLERLNAELREALAENVALHEQLLASAKGAGVQEERQRLAREIHDTLAQSLAGIVTQLEASVSGDRHDRALRLAREALTEARRSVLGLNPGDLDTATLPDALGAVVQAWTAAHGVRCDLVVSGDPVPVHIEVEAAVLRVTQESLGNVARHSAAGRVGVTLVYGDSELVLDVRDDGVGFDSRAEPARECFGLRGMRERAERLAGSVVVESRPGDGTAVSLRVPALAR
ncbi:MAG: sensor histidine kinase, partial [Phycicoccus sp.]